MGEIDNIAEQITCVENITLMNLEAIQQDSSHMMIVENQAQGSIGFYHR